MITIVNHSFHIDFRICSGAFSGLLLLTVGFANIFGLKNRKFGKIFQKSLNNYPFNVCIYSEFSCFFEI